MPGREVCGLRDPAQGGVRHTERPQKVPPPHCAHRRRQGGLPALRWTRSLGALLLACSHPMHFFTCVSVQSMACTEQLQLGRLRCAGTSLLQEHALAKHSSDIFLTKSWRPAQPIPEAPVGWRARRPVAHFPNDHLRRTVSNDISSKAASPAPQDSPPPGKFFHNEVPITMKCILICKKSDLYCLHNGQQCVASGVPF